MAHRYARWRRRVVPAISVIFVAMVGTGLTGGSASATDLTRCDIMPPNGNGHCYAVDHVDDNTIASTAFYENRNSLWTSVNTANALADSFIDSEYWLGLSNLSYLEAGLSYGIDGQASNPLCPNNPCYELFWAQTGSTGHQTIYNISIVPIDNSIQDVWTIGYYQGNWIVKLDGITRATSALTDATSDHINTGAELYQKYCDSAYSLGYFFSPWMHVQTKISGGSWQDPVWAYGINSCPSTYNTNSTGNGLFMWSK